MKRRNFLATATLPLISTSESLAESFNDQSTTQQLIEWRTYSLLSESKQEILDDYLQSAFIPAFNRINTKNVGVFKVISGTEPIKIHAFIPHASYESFATMANTLAKDKVYQSAANSFHSLKKENAIFSRYESSLLLGFEAMPQLVVPKVNKKVFELRTYESYSDDAARRKIDMFNKHEVKLFEDLGFKAVFYGKMLAGKYMPCLTYMVCFDNMEEMENYWNKFRKSEGWASIKDLPEYADTVSKIHKIFLEPLPYSQI